jgi:4-hydroxythreonine-4-phosphate dehydrogenase
MTLRIAITPGEPAGIGPDLLLQLAQQPWQAQLVAIADKQLLKERAQHLGLNIELIDFDENTLNTLEGRHSYKVTLID